MQRSAKKMRMGCTLAYCPFAFIFVSGSRCAPYHKKLFLIRSREMWYIAKEDPLGIVQVVQPEGSYFWDVPQIAAYSKKLVTF